MRHNNVVPQTKVSTGKTKEGSTLLRDTFVTVTKIDPSENVAVKVEILFHENKLLSSKDWHKDHWWQDPGFKDTSLILVVGL